ncbi:MAG: M48 family metallopeptidase [Hyphomonadaceae bacterium]
MAKDTRPAEIQLKDGRKLALKLAVNPRARRISIRIDAARREAIATAPSERQVKRALNFAAERAGWIEAELARLPQGRPFEPGAVIDIRGEPHLLIHEHGRAPPRYEPGKLVVQTTDPALFAARVKRFLMAEARADLEARVAAHARTLGVAARRVQVKETRSRWGSCSEDGALAFSWRVICAPRFVLDYLAAHETAHLREMNHSRRFWALVAKCTPHWKQGRDWLHHQGFALHAIGSDA